MYIEGGKPLIGTATPSPSSQEAVFILCAALFADGESIIRNLPRVGLVDRTLDILKHLGLKAEPNGKLVKISWDNLNTSTLFVDSPSAIASSFLCLGPLLSHSDQVKLVVSNPSYLQFPIVTSLLKLFTDLGYNVLLESAFCEISIPASVGEISLSIEKYSSFMTQVALLGAASLAGVTTVVNNPKIGPETQRLVDFLRKHGVPIEKIEDSDSLEIVGVEELAPFDHTVGPNLLETTLLGFASVITEGEISIKGVSSYEIAPLLSKLDQLDVGYEISSNNLTMWSGKTSQQPSLTRVDLISPLFSPAWEPHFCLLLSRLLGSSILGTPYTEACPDWVKDLTRMGVRVTFQSDDAGGGFYQVSGKGPLRSVHLDLGDTSVPEALFLAGSLVPGRTRLSNVGVLGEIYEDLPGKFSKLGLLVDESSSSIPSS